MFRKTNISYPLIRTPTLNYLFRYKLVYSSLFQIYVCFLSATWLPSGLHWVAFEGRSSLNLTYPAIVCYCSFDTKVTRSLVVTIYTELKKMAEII